MQERMMGRLRQKRMTANEPRMARAWAGKYGSLVGGAGEPKTDEERKARHAAMFGTSKLPPRGTGRMSGYLKRQGNVGVFG